MMRWLIGSSLKLRLLVLVIATAMMFVMFNFTHLRPLPVKAGVFTLHQPESSLSCTHCQSQTLGTFAQEVGAFTTTIVEADLVEDESDNKRKIEECTPCNGPIRDPLGLCSVSAELLVIVQCFDHRNAVLLI
jgi:hypothetical protein